MDKVVIITGGTTGIGAETVKLFLEEGYKVSFCGRNEETGRKILDIVNTPPFINTVDYSKRILFTKCNLENELEIIGFIENTINHFGSIDVVFNNAGVSVPSQDFETLDIKEWNKALDVNLKSIVLIMKYAKKYLINTRGCVINNASNAGLENCTLGDSYAYSVSKAAVIKLSKMMALNFAKYGIRVNCICPGFIKTALLRRPAEVYAPNIPLGRVGMPSEVANLVLYLASEKASYITGAVIPIDGGKALN